MKTNILSSALLLMTSSVFAANVYVSESYVDADANGTQSKPYTQLYTAIEYANAGDVICIAQGKYLPKVNSVDGARYSFFVIDKNLTLKGGYNSDFSQNDAQNYVTILSGDMDGNDSYNRRTGICSNNENNAYHVIYVNDSTSLSLEGVTIQGGYADLNNADGLPKSQSGGGIFTETGRLVLENVIIKGNGSNGKAGAGIYTANGIKANRVTFMGNVTGNDGGGLFVKSGLVVLTNSTFMENTANSGGGAFMLQGNTNGSYIANNVFYYNTTARYGTVSLYSVTDASTITLANNTIVNNTVTNSTNKSLGGGSAIYARGDEMVNVNLINNTIMGNIVQDGTDEGEGGAIFNRGVTINMANNVIAGNYCAVTGDDLYTNAGVFNSLGYNVFTTNAMSSVSATLTGATTNDIYLSTTKDAALTLLAQVFEGLATAYVFEAEQADNGGLTQTVKIIGANVSMGGKTIACIPATQLQETTLNADVNNDGNKTGALQTDQRGVARNVAGAACIGAYEVGDVTGNEQFADDSNMNVYVTNKMLYVNTIGDFNCTIYDMTGKMHLNTIATSGQSIDLSAFAKGMYVVMVRSTAGQTVRKIML